MEWSKGLTIAAAVSALTTLALAVAEYNGVDTRGVLMLAGLSSTWYCGGLAGYILRKKEGR